MPDILGPASASNALTLRPTDGRVFGAVDTWFGDCTTPSSNDGTLVQAAFLNGMLAQLRDTITASGITKDNADDMLTRAIRALAPTAAPGALMMWPKNTAPTGWLKMNGAAISRTTYSALFAVIGTAFGIGDGSTTFNIPDDRANFWRGWDDSRGIDSGRVFGSEQTDLLKDHQHLPPAGMSDFMALVNGAPVPDTPTTFGGSSYDWSFAGLTGGVSGGLAGSETRPRNRAWLPCIKY
jgi:phage-related tail fiber protein